MGYVLLISCILIFVAFGYFIMNRIDSFLSSGRFLEYDEHDMNKKTKHRGNESDIKSKITKALRKYK